MAKEKKKRVSKSWLLQIPHGFYQKEAMYWSGTSMELENFRRVVLLEEDKLCVETSNGYVTVVGESLTVTALEKSRVLVKGKFHQVSFSYFER